ncbi:SIS domain-containing protein [Utexia brackfieldae]|uniref:MurR/RpiR family transcriptional regulator n=1 Tax=Utexia brackfieldae TaxID=3074108 RepID=UPI00370D124B
MKPFIFNKIKDITGICGIARAFLRVSMLGENDLIIAICLPGCSKGIIELLIQAKEKNIKILAITDCLSLPMVAFADVTLLAIAQYNILYTINMAMFALIESLTTALAIKIKKSADYLTKQTDYLLPYFYFNTEE